MFNLSQGLTRWCGVALALSLLGGCTVTPTPGGDGVVIPDDPTASGELPPPSGAILWEKFDRVYEGELEEVKSALSAGVEPDERALVASLDMPRNQHDNFTMRVRGYWRPAATGTYRLYIRGSNRAAVWLSTDEQPENAQLMAGFTSSQTNSVWMRVPSQQSAPVTVEEGKSYYLEVIQVNGAGNDWFGLGWALADADPSTTVMLKNDQIAPFLPKALTPEVTVKYFEEGYRVGYTDGRYGFPVNTDFPAKDTDGDGLPDNWEVAMGLDPLNDQDALMDQDGDGLYALLEYNALTDTRNSDSDGDGIPDGWEISNGLSPVDAADALLLNAAGVTYLTQYRTEAGMPPPLVSGQVLVSWQAPTAREDGSNLALSDIAAYEVIYGYSEAAMSNTIRIEDPSKLWIIISDLEQQSVYVGIRALDSSGRISNMSAPTVMAVTK